MTDVQDKNQQSLSPWVPIAKEAARLLPIDRAFTEVEALFSLQLDHNNGNSVTVSGYSKRWKWNRERVQNFLKSCGLQVVYPMDTTKVQKQKGELRVPTDHPTENRQINFIDFNKLKGKSDRKPADQPTLLSRIKKENRKPMKKDPRVRVFIEWFSMKFQHKFGRPYQITNWAEVGKQVKHLLSLSLSWEELQYLAIEFLLDDDPFFEKAGHGIGQLLRKAGQNCYTKYLDPEFRANNAKHITGEPGSTKPNGQVGGLVESQEGE